MCVSPLHRMWRSDLPRGGCLLVSQSLDPEQPVPESGVRALMLTSQYLMEPCGLGRSRLTHICRADLRYQAPAPWPHPFLPFPWEGLLGRSHSSCLPASASPGAVLLTGTTKSSGTCVPWKWQRSGTLSPPCGQLVLRQSCEPCPGSRVALPSRLGTKGEQRSPPDTATGGLSLSQPEPPLHIHGRKRESQCPVSTPPPPPCLCPALPGERSHFRSKIAATLQAHGALPAAPPVGEGERAVCARSSVPFSDAKPSCLLLGSL